ncbi:MAG: sensor histidine kinase [Polyangiales bacterium]
MSKWSLTAALVSLLAGAYWALVEPPPPVLPTPLDVARVPAFVGLGRTVEVFEDPEGRATLADVRGRHAGAFRRGQSAELAPGLTDAAVWVRLPVVNGSTRDVQWVLELSEPTLDDVQLYVVHDDGHVSTRRTGDMRPFVARDVTSPAFVFYPTTPPGARETYFLRVASEDPVRVALAAYRPNDWFVKHEHDNLFTLALYGALLAASLYYLCVFAITRQSEYVCCALINLALLTVQASMYGHVTQFLLPTQPLVANRLLWAAIAAAMLGITVFARISLHHIEVSAKVETAVRRVVGGAVLLLVFSVSLPKSAVVFVVLGVLFAVCVLGPLLVRVLDTRRFPELRFIKACWLALLLTAPVGLLRFVGVLPKHPLFELALPLGFLAHGGAMSLGLSYWVTQMRMKVSGMNEELSRNVSVLQHTLAQAEEASRRAERATMAKDDFMATMSHELRTPLNAIINIPQGMISDFETVRSARCSECEAAYLLDEGDTIDAATRCEGCGGTGTLIEGTKVLFHGDHARCLRFLQKIERSGQHLLQMVNGVLDYSKLEAGRFQLVLEHEDLEALCREVVDQMSELGAVRRIEIVFTRLSVPPDMMFDPLRIRQVLINLVSNAIKFSEPDSVVGIELRSDDDAAVIEVQDAGIGIAREHHERIFAGFEQVHKGDTRKYGGTGLGLSIARSLVRMHGGELSVRSEVGKGATFVVRLPRQPKLGSHVSTVEMQALGERANDATTERKKLA